MKFKRLNEISPYKSSDFQFKRIFRTWKDENIPKNWIPGIESINELMPDYELIITTDEDNYNLIQDKYPQYLKAYQSFPHTIQKVDFVRVALLHYYGGIYMDLDFVCLKRLDNLFKDNMENYVVKSGNISSTITNSFFAAKRGSKLMEKYLEEMTKTKPYWALGKHFTVMCTTGPIKFNGVVQKHDEPIALLPSTLLMPCNVCNLNCDLNENVYLKPLTGGTWNDWSSLTVNALYCNWQKILILIIFIILLIFVIYIFNKFRYYYG